MLRRIYEFFEAVAVARAAKELTSRGYHEQARALILDFNKKT